MLNVFQLMMALLLCCVTATDAVPCPCTVAVPPTTVAPLGPADAEAMRSGISAVASRRSFRNGQGIRVPLISRRDDEEEPPIVDRSLYRFGDLQSALRYCCQPRRSPAPAEAALAFAGVPTAGEIVWSSP